MKATPAALTVAVTSVSWIPAGAVTGLPRTVFDVGLFQYDPPPPDPLGDVEQVRAAKALRFANVLEAWSEVADGRVVRAGYGSGSRLVLGSTTLRLSAAALTFDAVALPVLRRDPEYRDDGSVRLIQTCGGRAASPAPRIVRYPPFVQVHSPLVWTTLALTIHPDGTSEVDLVSASLFPQHWVYDAAGGFAFAAAPPDYSAWLAHSFGPRTPWG